MGPGLVSVWPLPVMVFKMTRQKKCVREERGGPPVHSMSLAHPHPSCTPHCVPAHATCLHMLHAAVRMGAPLQQFATRSAHDTASLGLKGEGTGSLLSGSSFGAVDAQGSVLGSLFAGLNSTPLQHTW